MYVCIWASFSMSSTYLFKSKSPLGFHKPFFTLGSGTSPPVSSITNTKSLSFLTSFSHPQKDLYGRRERRNVNNYTEKEVVCHTELHSPNGNTLWLTWGPSSAPLLLSLIYLPLQKHISVPLLTFGVSNKKQIKIIKRKQITHKNTKVGYDMFAGWLILKWKLICM